TCALPILLTVLDVYSASLGTSSLGAVFSLFTNVNLRAGVSDKIVTSWNFTFNKDSSILFKCWIFDISVFLLRLSFLVFSNLLSSIISILFFNSFKMLSNIISLLIMMLHFIIFI